MNPVFKSKYDQMRESMQPETTGDSAAAIKDNLYSEAGHIRNLCFVWPDGRMQFLNYSFLVSGEYIQDENAIILEFTTHKVTIKGYNLNHLYSLIISQTIKNIVCTITRYDVLNDTSFYLVNNITVEKLIN